MKENQSHYGVLALMTGLCLVIGMLAYLLVVSGGFAEQTAGETIPANAMIYTTPDLAAIGAASLQAEIFNLELTDMMAPLPMEGVELAGQRAEE